MAKYSGNINFGRKVNLKGLEDLIKAAGRKYSIRVGIIGEKAGEIHPGTNLTNAQLGAAHEFGATINNPGGQPYYINSSTGRAIFVSKNSLFGQYLIAKGQVTKPHTIYLPVRSFLRMPLLSSDGKRAVINGVLNQKEVDKDGNYTGKTYEISEGLSEFVKAGNSKNENNIAWKKALKKQIGKDIIELLPGRIAASALERVQDAFKTRGWGKWPQITAQTKARRKNDKTSPPLQDGGDLLDSITVEAKKLNG